MHFYHNRKNPANSIKRFSGEEVDDLDAKRGNTGSPLLALTGMQPEGTLHLDDPIDAKNARVIFPPAVPPIRMDV